jgi:hypothetical protein
MNITLSNTYVLKWQLKDNPQYKWTSCGKCINSKTGREIKKTICGRSIGYCIKGKFVSLNALRTQIEKINEVECPF